MSIVGHVPLLARAITVDTCNWDFYQVGVIQPYFVYVVAGMERADPHRALRALVRNSASFVHSEPRMAQK